MTQPATVAEVIPPVEAPPSPAEAPEAPRPMTMADVIQQVDGYCERVIAPLPSTRLFMWFPRRTPPEVSLLAQAVLENPDLTPKQKSVEVNKFLKDLEPTAITPGKPCPLDIGLDVVWMFLRDGSTYLYCLPLSKNDDVNKREVLASKPPTRFVLSMHGPQFVVETMPLLTWLLEVADELEAVDENSRTVPTGIGDEPEDDVDDVDDGDDPE